MFLLQQRQLDLSRLLAKNNILFSRRRAGKCPELPFKISGFVMTKMVGNHPNISFKLSNTVMTKMAGNCSYLLKTSGVVVTNVAGNFPNFSSEISGFVLKKMPENLHDSLLKISNLVPHFLLRTSSSIASKTSSYGNYLTGTCETELLEKHESSLTSNRCDITTRCS